ncbi:MAG: DUF4231 domain-containing protein [Nostoc sp. DedVER02]|uniref:DUF4231 domain-containing protein n=1 Tax=unclassified Nostoc TaxID=2593658 RepID=UPI002AD2CFCE|nr:MULTISPECIES: DUF4231 domain-containing protein [unclassified Nostoc]MDZ7988138.1 DUF4231 domain-containing protein [Nostoc sp. DedVER02]MDZ8116200.1 DUF4231 domain-containing protein [Nostoc sp. DedVER01b]
MAKKDSYQEFLREDFNKLFESMNLADVQRHFLRSRWLEQVLWMEGKANSSRDRHYWLRITTIIGGVILPALVSLNISTTQPFNDRVKNVIIWSTFGLSQIVAISAAVEEFFHYGERWRHYRRTVESLKTQGWQFSQLAGPYSNYTSHEQAFNVFAGNVEDIIQRDVEIYATQVVQEKKEEQKSQESYILMQNTKITNLQEKKEEE